MVRYVDSGLKVSITTRLASRRKDQEYWAGGAGVPLKRLPAQEPRVFLDKMPAAEAEPPARKLQHLNDRCDVIAPRRIQKTGHLSATSLYPSPLSVHRVFKSVHGCPYILSLIVQQGFPLHLHMRPVDRQDDITVMNFIVIIMDYFVAFEIFPLRRMKPFIKRSSACTGQHLIDGMPGLIIYMRPIIQMVVSAEVHPDAGVPEAVPERITILGIISPILNLLFVLKSFSRIWQRSNSPYLNL